MIRVKIKSVARYIIVIVATIIVTLTVTTAGILYFDGWNMHGVSNIITWDGDFTRVDKLTEIGVCDGKTVYTYGVGKPKLETLSAKYIPLEDYLKKDWVTQKTLTTGGYNTYVDEKKVVRFEAYYIVVQKRTMTIVANDVEFSEIMNALDAHK